MKYSYTELDELSVVAAELRDMQEQDMENGIVYEAGENALTNMLRNLLGEDKNE